MLIKNKNHILVKHTSRRLQTSTENKTRAKGPSTELISNRRRIINT